MTLNMRDLDEEIITHDNTGKTIVQNVLDDFERLGFDLVDKPRNKPPKLPSKGISTLGDNDIANLQSEFVRWMEYAGEQAEIQNAVAKEFSSEMDDTILKFKLKYEGTVAEKEARAKTHPSVRKLRRKFLKSKALYALLENKYKIFDAARGVCSRDVERRRKDFVANVNEDSIRSMRARKATRKKGPIRQRDLEIGRGR